MNTHLTQEDQTAPAVTQAGSTVHGCPPLTLATRCVIAVLCISIVGTVMRTIRSVSTRTGNVTLQLSLRNVATTPPARQTFYLISLRDASGNILVPARLLAAEATQLAGGTLTPSGHGIFADLPSTGSSFALDWSGTVDVARGSEVFLEFGRAVRGSVLRARLGNGTPRDIDLSAMPGNEPYRQLIGTLPQGSRALRYGLLAILSALAYGSIIVLHRNHRLWRFVMRSPLIKAGIVAAPVILFSLHVVGADLLWQDDGYWYHQACLEAPILSGFEWIGTHCALSHLRHASYSYAMVFLGVGATRTAFILCMALTSWVLFVFYRRTWSLTPCAAFLASVVPHILPSLEGIPVGLNTTYALFPMLGVLISASLLSEAVTRPGRLASWGWCLAAILTFTAALEITSTGVFLLPCLLWLALLFLATNWRKALVFMVGAATLGVVQLHQQILHGSRQPVPIPLHEVLARCIEFVRMSSFLPLAPPWDVRAAITLAIGGILCLLIPTSGLLGVDASANFYRPWLRRLGLAGWLVGWVVVNSYPYVAASPAFRVADYAYVSNFGLVALQACALLALAGWVLRLFSRTPQFRSACLWAVTVLLVLQCGDRRIVAGIRTYAPFERSMRQLRNGLRGHTFPSDSQIVVLGMPPPVDYLGLYAVNSGQLCRTLQRRDVAGVLGPNKFPNDPFVRGNEWVEPMVGLRLDQPLFVYRVERSQFLPVRLLLQVSRRQVADLPREAWTLHRLDLQTGARTVLARGNGLDSFAMFMERELPPDLHGETVAFGPSGPVETILDVDTGSGIEESPSLLTGAIGFGEHLELRHVKTIETADGLRLSLLVAIRSKPAEPFFLGYALNGTVIELPLYDYARPGDLLRITTAPITPETLKAGVRLRLVKTRPWPCPPLPVRGATAEQPDGSILIQSP